MASVWLELKRRNVFKVGAAYAIVAWLLIQIADVILPTFEAPAWVMQVFTFFVMLGFPIALLLAWAYEMTPEGIRAASKVQPTESITRATGLMLNYFIVGLLVLAVGFLVVDQYVLETGARVAAIEPVSPASSPNIRRFNINVGPTAPIGNTRLGVHTALSPDGRLLAYAAQVDDTSQLYLRALDQLEARALPNTEGAQHPFFSPDGEWVAFYTDEADGELRRVAVRSGQAQTLARAPGSASGGFWSADGSIVFAYTAAGVRSLFRIPATGGTPERIAIPGPDVGHQWPSYLPGGNAVLFVLRPGPGGAGPIRTGKIAVLSLESGEHRVLIDGGHRPLYAPTGHIVFVRSGALWAAPFDAERLEIAGPEVPVLDGVDQNGQIGGAAFSFSNDGLLVYAPGGEVAIGSPRAPVWVDREGREERLTVEPRAYVDPQLSPDGQRLATSAGGDIWIIDLTLGTSSRLTFNPGDDFDPVWTPDGQRVVFWSSRADEEGGLFWQAANGTGQAERLTSSLSIQDPEAFGRDGTALIFRDSSAGNAALHVLSMDGEPVSQPLLDLPTFQGSLALSPDGRWIAYSSNETGQREIYARPFPDVNAGRWQISTGGGSDPHWGPEGAELFFRDGDAVLVADVEVAGESLVAATPEELFSGTYRANLASEPNYDLSPDGQHFLMLKILEPEQQRSDQASLVAVENWFEELERLAPPNEGE